MIYLKIREAVNPPRAVVWLWAAAVVKLDTQRYGTENNGDTRKHC
jgi:hypothetical protein